jgi:hypothetical protein
MADNETKKDAAPSAADLAKDAGRAPQAMEAAKTPAEHEKATRTEAPPKANPGTESKPKADANPDEVAGMGDSWPNMMSTAGLNAIQRARVEGTPMDGQLGGAVLSPREVRVPSREERLADRAAADAAERGDKK